MSAPKEVSLPVAAFKLGVSYERAKRRLFTGELEGRQDHNGKWLVDLSSVERLLEQRTEPAAATA